MHKEAIYDDEFGEIQLRYDIRAVRYTFHAKSRRLHATLPFGVSEKELRPILEKKREALRRLLVRVSGNTLSVGNIIETRCFNINIETYRGEKILYAMRDGCLIVLLPHDADIGEPLLSENIKRGIMRFVKQSAATYLKARLDAAAARLRLKYNTFAVASGRRLLFYPEELIDYVIYHELAHLTVMNHGAAFHELCNKYCSGRENELRKRLRYFPLPM